MTHDLAITHDYGYREALIKREGLHKAALSMKFRPHHHLEEMTVREFFRDLLAALWWEGEGFSSKRPFGDSSWQAQLYGALALAGYLPREWMDEDGYYLTEAYDEKEARSFVIEMIRAMD